jgi:two-component system, LytTR family, response regulator
MNCIIIDDEPKARNLLAVIIEQYCPSLKVLAHCEDLPNGIKAIKKHKPELIFLDIEMPGHSGLEILDFFDETEIDFSIIFTTAYNEYALQAFKLSAIDYLLKPIQHTQLMEAVQRFEQQQKQQSSLHLKALQQNLNAQTNWDEKRIVVPSGQAMHFLKPAEVVMIKGEAAYSEFYLSNGSKLLASYNLKHFEDLLSNIPTFLRCHKSYIVNTQKVLQLVKSDGGYLKMEGGLQAAVSPNKTEELMAKINN